MERESAVVVLAPGASTLRYSRHDLPLSRKYRRKSASPETEVESAVATAPPFFKEIVFSATAPRAAVPNPMVPPLAPPALPTSTVMEIVFPLPGSFPSGASLPPEGRAGIVTESETSVRIASLTDVPSKFPKYQRTASPSFNWYELAPTLGIAPFTA